MKWPDSVLARGVSTQRISQGPTPRPIHVAPAAYLCRGRRAGPIRKGIPFAAGNRPAHKLAHPLVGGRRGEGGRREEAPKA